MTRTPSHDPTAAEPFAVAVAAVAARAATAPRPVVLVDGRSGTGKSTFARLLAQALPRAQLVRMDDLYAGWDGLDVSVRHVVAHVLDPTAPRWRRWDWAAGTPAEWVPLDPERPLVVEGTGALSRESRRRATLAVWVRASEAVRRERALARDGDLYLPHWDRWARQEDAFVARERPDLLADVVIDTDGGTASVS